MGVVITSYKAKSQFKLDFTETGQLELSSAIKKSGLVTAVLFMPLQTSFLGHDHTRKSFNY